MITEHIWGPSPDVPNYHCTVCSISKVSDHATYNCVDWQKKIERDYRNELLNKKDELLAVGALHCHKCDVVIYSRAGHDFHYCDCKDIFIDGGRGYMRWGCEPGASYSGVTLMLPVTQRELYDDWNNRDEKYGWLRKLEDNPIARKAAITAPTIRG
jgi:hypothetical protein